MTTANYDEPWIAEHKRDAKAMLIEYLDDVTNARPAILVPDIDVLSALLYLEDELRELCSK
jgi:hypothetical protein